MAKFNRNFGKTGYYKPSPSSTDNTFTVNHYAGQVSYLDGLFFMPMSLKKLRGHIDLCLFVCVTL